MAQVQVSDGTQVWEKRASAGESNTAESLRGEFQILSTLRHPCLPEPRYIREDRSGWVLGCELADGITIEEFTDELTGSRFDQVAMDLLGTLAVVHACGLVHYDVSPRNILVHVSDEGAETHLIDFGMAGRPGEHAAGTIGFMSPEEMRGGTGGVLSDLYSLGLVLIRLATGKRWVYEGTPREVSLHQQRTMGEQIADLRNTIGTPRANIIASLVSGEKHRRTSDAASTFVLYSELCPNTAQAQLSDYFRSLRESVSWVSDRALWDRAAGWLDRMETSRARLGQAESTQGKRLLNCIAACAGERGLQVAWNRVAGAGSAQETEIDLWAAGEEYDGKADCMSNSFSGETEDVLHRMVRIGWDESCREEVAKLVLAAENQLGFDECTFFASLVGKAVAVRRNNSWVASKLRFEDQEFACSSTELMQRFNALPKKAAAWTIVHCCAEEMGAEAAASIIRHLNITQKSEIATMQVKQAGDSDASAARESTRLTCQLLRPCIPDEFLIRGYAFLSRRVGWGSSPGMKSAEEYCRIRQGKVDAGRIANVVCDVLKSGDYDAARLLVRSIGRAGAARKECRAEMSVLRDLIMCEIGIGGSEDYSPVQRTGDSEEYRRIKEYTDAKIAGDVSDEEATVSDKCSPKSSTHLCKLLNSRATSSPEGASEYLRVLVSWLESEELIEVDTLASEWSVVKKSLKGIPPDSHYCVLTCVLQAVRRYGALLAGSGRMIEAANVFLEGVRLADGLNMKRERLIMESNYASALLSLGETDEAYKQLKGIAAERERLGDIVGAASSWSNAGVALYKKDDVKAALAAWYKQVSLLKSMGLWGRVGIALNRIGCGLESCGEPGEASRVLTESFNILKATSDSRSSAITAANAARVELVLGRVHSAGDWLRRCKSLTEDIDIEGRILNDVEAVDMCLRIEMGAFSAEEPRNEYLWDSISGDLEIIRFHFLSGIEVRSTDVSALTNSDERLIASSLGMGETGDLGACVKMVSSLLGALRESSNEYRCIRIAEATSWLIVDTLTRGGHIPRSAVEELLLFSSGVRHPTVCWQVRTCAGVYELRQSETRAAALHLLSALSGVCRSFGSLSDDEWARAFGRRDLRSLLKTILSLGEKVLGSSVSDSTPAVLSGSSVSDLYDVVVEVLNEGDDGGGDSGGRWERGMKLMLSVAEAVSEARDISSVLGMVVDSLLELCDAERGFVALVDDAGISSVRVAKGDMSEDELEANISSTVVADVINGRASVLVRNALDDEGLLNAPSIRRLSVRSIMCSPLVQDGRVYGVIYVDNLSAIGSFADRDLKLLELFAHNVSIAIKNAELITELEESYGQLSEAHERIVRSERLKVLGEMASGVAHDFNNLLTSILIRSQVLRGECDREAWRGELELIEKAALDGASAIRRIQDFTRVRQHSDFDVVCLGQSIRDAIEFTRGRWVSSSEDGSVLRSVSVDCSVVDDLEVLGNGPELREVVTNLVLNAIEASPSAGTVRVALTCDGGSAVLNVEDEGLGVPLALREKVFDPFFSTKGEDGNGLGLSVAYGIVKRHGGEISVGERGGGGACFTVRLPLAQARDKRVIRVLLIEDEEMVRGSIAGYLQGVGVEVLAVESGERGLEEFSPEEFDAVISDQGLPGISGLDVLRGVRGTGFSGTVVLMTGKSIPLNLLAEDARRDVSIIYKPFELAELERALFDK